MSTNSAMPWPIWKLFLSSKPVPPSERRQTEVDLDMHCLPLNPLAMCDLLPDTNTNNLVSRASGRHQSSQHNVFQFSQLVGDEGKCQKEKEEGFGLWNRGAEPEFRSREKAELDGKKLSPLASKHPCWCGLRVWTTWRILNTLFWRLPRNTGDSETVESSDC